MILYGSDAGIYLKISEEKIAQTKEELLNRFERHVSETQVVIFCEEDEHIYHFIVGEMHDRGEYQIVRR